MVLKPYVCLQQAVDIGDIEVLAGVLGVALLWLVVLPVVLRRLIVLDVDLLLVGLEAVMLRLAVLLVFLLRLVARYHVLRKVMQ